MVTMQSRSYRGKVEVEILKVEYGIEWDSTEEDSRFSR